MDGAIQPRRANINSKATRVANETATNRQRTPQYEAKSRNAHDMRRKVRTITCPLSSTPSHQPLPPTLLFAGLNLRPQTAFYKLPNLFACAIQTNSSCRYFANGNDASLAVHDFQHVLSKAIRTIGSSQNTVLKIFHTIPNQMCRITPRDTRMMKTTSPRYVRQDDTRT